MVSFTGAPGKPRGRRDRRMNRGFLRWVRSNDSTASMPAMMADGESRNRAFEAPTCSSIVGPSLVMLSRCWPSSNRFKMFSVRSPGAPKLIAA